MPTVFIANLALDLPSRWKEGDTLDELHAQILDEILHRRVGARLRRLLARNEIATHELQAKALELCAQDLKPYATLDDTDDDDPILLEALAIARDLIIAQMAKEGLPPPKGIDIHAKALVDAMPALQEQARKRVEARYRATQELLSP